MSEKQQPHKYHAFISYRHVDNKQPGRQWATWLQQAIETYEVPTDLVGGINGWGDEISARIFPIFRDEEELSANADLGKSIINALDSTQLLIVLCSPQAVASTYVADEIDYFKKRGYSDRIITAIIDGEPNTSWDKSKQAAGFKVNDECFPIPLQFEYDEQGNQTEKHSEPIAADFRLNYGGMPEQAWTSIEAYRQHLKTNTEFSNKDIQKRTEAYQRQQHLMLLKIIAGILCIPLGELTQRDKEYQLKLERQKTKKLRRWLVVLSILVVLLIPFIPPLQTAIEKNVTQWINRGIKASYFEDQPMSTIRNSESLVGLRAYLFQYHDWSRSFLEELVIPETVAISTGKVVMGDSNEEDAPVHTVDISLFGIGRYEVTVGQYHEYCIRDGRACPSDPAPNYSDDLNVPAVFVAWDEARNYAIWLSELIGKTYRLPTEAEWEYAARAGSKLIYGFADSPERLAEYAWYGNTSDGHGIQVNHGFPVGKKKPNSWNLYDIQGNAWEWTSSIYKQYPYNQNDGRENSGKLDYRVIRGGSWYNHESETALAHRMRYHPGKREGIVGFRIASN